MAEGIRDDGNAEIDECEGGIKKGEWRDSEW